MIGEEVVQPGVINYAVASLVGPGGGGSSHHRVLCNSCVEG